MRDPRAIFASMKNDPGGASFSQARERKSLFCSLMKKDLGLERELPASRYVRVRYEDLMNASHGIQVLASLYDFMGIDFGNGEKLARRVQKVRLGGVGRDVPLEPDADRIRKQEDMSKKKLAMDAYYNTERGADFDPNHWMKELTKEERMQLCYFYYKLSIRKSFSLGMQEVAEIEGACKETILALGYKLTSS